MRYVLMDQYIGQLFKEERTKRGLSMQDVCNAVGIKQRQTLYSYEIARLSMPFDIFKRTCSFYGLDYRDVFTQAQKYMFENTEE